MRACVYEKLFVPLHAFYGRTDTTYGSSTEHQRDDGARGDCADQCLFGVQGEEYVEVTVRERLAWKAVLLAYILPFIVMIGVIIVLDFATEWSEAVVGTLSLCAIALYYIGLSFFKNRLQKQFVFTARKI